MSFGFGVGDFLAVLKLINDVRKTFIDAPKEFDDISREVRNLSIVLQDIEIRGDQLSEAKTIEVKEIIKSCEDLFDELKESLEKYSDVGKVQGKGVSARMKRIWKRVKWEPDDIRDIRSRIVSNVSSLQAVEAHVMNRKLDKLVQRQDDTERSEILQWISMTDYAARQNDLIRLHQPGSRRWLLDSAEFHLWKKTKGKTLFCPGIPGAGKTFTMAIVVDALTKLPPAGSLDVVAADTAVCYLYCSYQNKEQTAIQLLGSLLRNVLQQRPVVPAGIVALFNANKPSGKGMADKNEVLRLLQELMSAFGRIYIFIDALDELSVEVRRPFVRDLLALQVQCSANLFLTSRPISAISRSFKSETEVEIRASEADVKAYLTDYMGELVPDFVLDNAELKNLVIDSITKACEGMFLLAQLHLESLKGKTSPKALRKALGKLATGSSAYDDAYEKAMRRIEDQPEDSSQLAKDALRLVTCVQRPLQVDELRHALGVELREQPYEFDIDNIPEIDLVVSVCAGLLAVDKESNMTRLVHKSAQEYFERNQDKWFPNAHGFIAIICHTYRSTVESSTDRFDVYSFYEYSKDHWGYHQNLGEESLAGAADSEAKQGIVRRNTTLSQATLAEMGISQLAREFGSMDTALIWACENGKQSIVELLLQATGYNLAAEHDYEVKEHGPDSVLLTAAAIHGRTGILELLLAKGADPNTKSSHGLTALYVAARGGHTAAVSLLLEQDTIDVDVTGTANIQGEYETGGGVSASGLLAAKELQWTPLLGAAYKGHLTCVEALWNCSNIAFKDYDGRNVLWLATVGSHGAVVETLLKSPFGLEHLWSYVEDTSPFILAVMQNDIRSAQAMIAACPELCMNDLKLEDHPINRIVFPDFNHVVLKTSPSFPQTTYWPDHCHILHLAAFYTSSEMIELLLRSADEDAVESLDSDRRTPLELVAGAPWLFGNMAALHIHGGAKLDLKEDDGRYKVQGWMEKYCHVELLEFIRPRLNFDINATDDRGNTLLHRILLRLAVAKSVSTLPSTTKEVRFIQSLLEDPDIDPNLRDMEGMTPLLRCCKSGYQRWTLEDRLQVLNSLLQHPSLNINDPLRGALAAFEEADNMWYGVESAIYDYLLTHPALVVDGNTLHYASKTGMIVLCERLLATHPEIDVNWSDEQGTTALMLATEPVPEQKSCTSDQVLHFLLSRPDIRVNQVNKEGRSVLHLAVKSRAWSACSVLLSSDDVHVNLTDHDGITPFLESTNTLLDMALWAGRGSDILPLFELKIWELFLGCHRVDLDKPDNNGRTALLNIVKSDRTGELIRKISSIGITTSLDRRPANPHVESVDGETAVGAVKARLRQLEWESKPKQTEDALKSCVRMWDLASHQQGWPQVDLDH